MKLKLLSITMALAVSPLFADSQTALDQLQAQINTLQTQVNQMTSSTATAQAVGLDTANPFGALSKVFMPLQLVKTREQGKSLLLGGQIEGDLQYWDGDNLATSSGAQYDSGSSVAATKVYLFTEANIGQNAMGFLSLKNGSNNSVIVDRAFVMAGELNGSNPIFVTAGSTYLPFGLFVGNGPLNVTLTTDAFRVSPTNQLTANAVFGPVDFIASAYNNASTVNNSINGLFTVQFSKLINQMHYNFGASYLNNVVGTNSDVGSAFVAGSSPSNPAWDANFNVGMKALSLIGEYVSTINGATIAREARGDLSSWVLGVNGGFECFSSPYFWQMSYSATHNMQNIATPLDGNFQNGLKTSVGLQHQWIGSLQGEYWTNVYLGPELTYGTLYNGQNTYSAILDMTAYF